MSQPVICSFCARPCNVVPVGSANATPVAVADPGYAPIAQSAERFHGKEKV